VYLTGKVLNKDGSPVVSAQVRLVQSNLAAVTNSSGTFLLSEPLSGSGAALAKAVDKDTLRIKKDSQEVVSREITKFIDTLPDFYIIQRDIYGSITNSVTDFSKIEAVIREANDSVPKKVALWFNKGVNGYSGFVYFPYTNELHNYIVRVNLYSVDSLLIGRSDSVVFPSTAGNIQIPLINPLNALPFANAGADTVVSFSDTVRLHGIGGDRFDSTVAGLAWDVGGKGTFVQTRTGDTVFCAGSISDSDFICILRVTDNDGNIAYDTAQIEIFEKRIMKGLAAYYPFNGNANDSSGNGNNGAVYGATLAPDRFGRADNAYSFNGTSDWIKVENSPTLNINGYNSLSICAWIKPTSIQASQDYCILWKWGPGGAEDDQYTLEVQGAKAIFRLSDLPSALTSNTIINPDLWYFLTGVYDAQAGKSRIYINGLLDNEMNLSFSIYNTTQFVGIGCGTNSTGFFAGYIDDIRIYNRALSVEEIQGLYNERP
jgi:hypothetical protein